MSQEKATFYSWKQVLKMPNTLNDAIIHQSNDWFLNRDNCVMDAKRNFKDDSNITKRVIIKKSRWTLPVDEVDMMDKMKLVENLLTLCYCLEVTKSIRKLSFDMCFGCMFDEEGEQEHTCQTFEEDLVEKYFNMALSEVDEDKVHVNWRKLLADDSLHGMMNFNLIAYSCKDYRDTYFKTPTWSDGLKGRVTKMLKLDKTQ